MQTINEGEKTIGYILKNVLPVGFEGRLGESWTISIFHSFVQMPLRTFITYGATRTKRILVIAVIGVLVSARLSTAIQATQSWYLGSKSLHTMTAKYSGTWSPSDVIIKL